MNITDIISVDPGQNTLGALHKNITGKILRNSGITRNNEPSSTSYFLTLIFASAAPGGMRYGLCMFVFRAMFAAILIVSGSFILSGEIVRTIPIIPIEIFAISEIVIGALLFLGFLSRFTMLTALVGFGIIATVNVINGVFNMSSLMLCMTSFIFLILGSGKISCDFLIRKAIVRQCSRRRSKMVADRMSYRAYKVAGYN